MSAPERTCIYNYYECGATPPEQALNEVVLQHSKFLQSVRRHAIRVCFNLPYGIRTTREFGENRKRVSAHRVIQGRRK